MTHRLLPPVSLRVLHLHLFLHLRGGGDGGGGGGGGSGSSDGGGGGGGCFVLLRSTPLRRCLSLRSNVFPALCYSPVVALTPR